MQLRIVLVGKTGVGKSATGNTILGERRFRSEISSSSVTSESELEDAVISGKKISVIDTPGLFDTNLTKTQLAEEIATSIFLSRPGPHAFLYLQPVNIRFTTQEKNVIEKLEKIFGENMRKYTIIVFTYGDQLKGKSVDNFIQENTSLRKVIEQCGGRYHIINNKQRNKQQVTDLLQKIDRLIEENREEHYTSEIYEKAMRFETLKEFYQENKKALFIAATAGMGSGAVVGASIGHAVGGPAAAGVGPVVGGVVGGVVGVVRHILVNKQEGQCAEHGRDEEEEPLPNPDDIVISTESENVPLHPVSIISLRQQSHEPRAKLD